MAKQKSGIANLADFSAAIKQFSASRQTTTLKMAGTISAKGPGPVDVRFTEAVNYGCGLEDGTELFIKEEKPAPKHFVGTIKAPYKCDTCGHVQQVTEVHTEVGVFCASGANWCDNCETGKPQKVEKELTPRQSRRLAQLAQLELAVAELTAFASELGMPTRFGKSLAEMTVYVQQQAAQLEKS